MPNIYVFIYTSITYVYLLIEIIYSYISSHFDLNSLSCYSQFSLEYTPAVRPYYILTYCNSLFYIHFEKYIPRTNNTRAHTHTHTYLIYTHTHYIPLTMYFPTEPNHPKEICVRSRSLSRIELRRHLLKSDLNLEWIVISWSALYIMNIYNVQGNFFQPITFIISKNNNFLWNFLLRNVWTSTINLWIFYVTYIWGFSPFFSYSNKLLRKQNAFKRDVDVDVIQAENSPQKQIKLLNWQLS